MTLQPTEPHRPGHSFLTCKRGNNVYFMWFYESPEPPTMIQVESCHVVIDVLPCEFSLSWIGVLFSRVLHTHTHVFISVQQNLLEILGNSTIYMAHFLMTVVVSDQLSCTLDRVMGKAPVHCVAVQLAQAVVTCDIKSVAPRPALSWGSFVGPARLLCLCRGLVPRSSFPAALSDLEASPSAGKCRLCPALCFHLAHCFLGIIWVV